nr:MAG TPA: hypothetical protein [Caudoviricetes sp.]
MTRFETWPRAGGGLGFSGENMPVRCWSAVM